MGLFLIEIHYKLKSLEDKIQRFLNAAKVVASNNTKNTLKYGINTSKKRSNTLKIRRVKISPLFNMLVKLINYIVGQSLVFLLIITKILMMKYREIHI